VTQNRYQRTNPNLFDIIANLEERIRRLETAPRLSSTSIDSGQLVLKGGDIVVQNDDGEVVLRILHGNVPEIRMTPTGGDTDYRAYQYSWEHDTMGTVYQAGIQDATGAQDGGKLLLMQSGSYLSYQPAAGNEVYISLGALSGFDEGLYFRGRWPTNVVVDGTEALAMGSVNIAAGVSSYSHTYGTPFATAPGVVYGLLNSAGAVTHSLTASSTSGFTVAWTGTLAKTLYWWAFRL
jgi:hypothetical protein